MEARPKLKIKLSTLDKLVEVTNLIIILFVWINIIYYFSGLPEFIPLHFGFSGKANDFGSKYDIFIPASIGTLLYIGLTVLNWFPQIFYFPNPITKENVIEQYTLATRMFRVLKLSLVSIFVFVVLKTISTSLEKTNEFGIWLLPVAIALIFIPLIYFIVKLFKVGKK